jgi:hypothetical protein
MDLWNRNVVSEPVKGVRADDEVERRIANGEGLGETGDDGRAGQVLAEDREHGRQRLDTDDVRTRRVQESCELSGPASEIAHDVV